MKFEQALREFLHEINKEYGDLDPVVSISIRYDLFDKVCRDLFSKPSYFGDRSMSFRPSDMNNINIMNVEIRAREREK